MSKCDHCLGACPENCNVCIYGKCKKEVDEKLTDYHYQKYINNIDTENEYKYWKEFIEWYKAYFQLK